MEFLIYIGVALSIAGIVVLVYAMAQAFRLKKQTLTNTEFTARMQHLGILNLGAIAVSTLGLMMVVIGVML